MNKKIRDVNLMAEAILKDEELMDAIDKLEMSIIDEKLKLQFAYENGQKQGKEEGEKQNSIKIAKEMKKAKEPIEKIIQFTGLSKEEIEQL